MDSYLLLGAAAALGALLYFVFFRETKTVSVGPIGQPPFLEPLAPRDWVEAELAEYNGRNGKPIYISVDGVVFNMSSHPSGPSFYGPDGPYGPMAGRDATIALATMNVDPAQCTKRTIAELSASERDTLADWVSRFSAKYEVAGFLNDGANPRSMASANGDSRPSNASNAHADTGGASASVKPPQEKKVE